MSESNANSPVVRKSNALARARWNPDSIWEPRLVALVASKIQTYDTDFQVYEILIVDILGKNTGGHDYKELEKAVDKAMSRIITIRTDRGWKKYTLFSNCEFDSKLGILKIGFHPDLKEHYLNLKQYMKFNLTEFMMLPSIYSQRLFEILKSWDDRNEVVMSLSELHEMLDTPKSLRTSYKDMKKWVLEKAHRDINTKTSFAYNWEPIKVGRAVKEIRFIFIKQKQRQQPKKINASPQAQALVRKALGVGSPEEFKEQRKVMEHGKFLQFLARFKHKESVYEAGSMWQRLHAAGNAPMASDVPDDNELSPLDFLVQWQEKHGITLTSGFQPGLQRL